MDILGKLRKNFESVQDGFEPLKTEWYEQNAKVKDAINNKDLPDLVHHLSGYRQAAQEHLHKLWFYTFWPKWALVVYLISSDKF
tara:strand:- start:14 stop:265 length:252 start_codon:yes stop_codon:yes gene_type:complete